jgi:TM2 domain-containing membrane protein YozV
MQYFLKINNQVIGPMQAHQVFAYDVNPNIAVSTDGLDWRQLYSYPELMQIYHQQGYGQMSDSEVSSKKTLCGIMAMLFGSLGVQYFILGKTAGGFITILLSLITCGAWATITFIQGIVMLCMSDADFKRKFIDSTSTLPLF